jgi:hypothetical protein
VMRDGLLSSESNTLSAVKALNPLSVLHVVVDC